MHISTIIFLASLDNDRSTVETSCLTVFFIVKSFKKPLLKRVKTYLNSLLLRFVVFLCNSQPENVNKADQIILHGASLKISIMQIRREYTVNFLLLSV